MGERAARTTAAHATHFSLAKALCSALKGVLDKARIPDSYGRLPLHYAAGERDGVEAVKLLLREFPQAARHADNDGWFPLHMAVSILGPTSGFLPEANAEAVSAILKEYPDAVKEATANGRTTPLGLAAMHGNAEMVEMLLPLHPEAAKVKQHDGGQFPVEHMLLAGTNRRVVTATKMLLDAAPEVAQEIDMSELEGIEPQLLVMVSLARVNRPPSRPWTMETAYVLRGIRAAPGCSMEVAAFIDEHLARVRALLLVARRRELAKELTLRIVGCLYTAEMFSSS